MKVLNIEGVKNRITLCMYIFFFSIGAFFSLFFAILLYPKNAEYFEIPFGQKVLILLAVLAFILGIVSFGFSGKYTLLLKKSK